jgi:hypothetical protein
VLSRGVPVGIDVICGFLDFLCAFIIISYRFFRRKSLDNVILPASWIVSLSRFFGSKLQDKYCRPEKVYSFLEIAQDLLKRLAAIVPDDDASRQFMFDGKTLSGHEDLYTVRDVFVSRMYVLPSGHIVMCYILLLTLSIMNQLQIHWFQYVTFWLSY